MAPVTQKALLLSGPAGKRYVGEAPVPKPGPQDVLVKVVAAALNPVDWKLAGVPITAIIPGSEYPFIAGSDGAGIVEEVGGGGRQERGKLRRAHALKCEPAYLDANRSRASRMWF